MRRDDVVDRPVTTAVAGVLVLLCAVAATASAAVPGHTALIDSGPRYGWNYLPAVWSLLAGLGAAGVVMLARPRLARPAAAVAAVLAAQVAGHGVVAVRDWFHANAASGMAENNLATVVTFAAAVAVAATVAACVSVAVLWHEPATGWRALLRPARPGYVAAGAALAAGLPLVAGAAFGDADLTSLGQAALMWSLPWGGGLAALGWLGPQAGRAAGLAIAGSVLSTLISFTRFFVWQLS
ncbi:MAG TPA: hypothetical protein VES42_13960 [Pilimelia sp.]|nr:hypothetical protein [Pilimelia sp.]